MRVFKLKKFVLANLALLFTISCGKPLGETLLSSEKSERNTFEGVATYFDGHGYPYGGCGIPEKELESPYFVALNVQHTPNNYDQYLPRPLQDSNTVGTWENGKNCGRWVRVTMSDFCTNHLGHGEKGKQLCSQGQWVGDDYNGRTLDMLVSDSCHDGNVWCRDDKHHLDLATAALEKFGSGLKDKWNNRKINWHFIKAPNYQGDIRIGFRQNSKPYWPAISVTRLENGVSAIEQEINGQFRSLRMDGDMGQAYVLEATPNNRYRIRLYDAQGQLIHAGRIYDFSFPCVGSCTEPFHEVSYLN